MWLEMTRPLSDKQHGSDAVSGVGVKDKQPNRKWIVFGDTQNNTKWLFVF